MESESSASASDGPVRAALASGTNGAEVGDSEEVVLDEDVLDATLEARLDASRRTGTGKPRLPAPALMAPMALAPNKRGSAAWRTSF